MAFQKQDNQSDFIAGDIDETTGGEELSLKPIAWANIRKLMEISCEEFTAGYWEKKPVKTSGGVLMMDKYKPDNRAAYCNGVNFLYDIVYPFSDEQFKEEAKNIENNLIIEYNTLKDKSNIDVWTWKKLEYKRQLFQKIIIMMERNDFFKSGSFYVDE